MSKDTIEELLDHSDRAEMLEEFAKLLESASRVVILVETSESTADGRPTSRDDYCYMTLGFRRVYEIEGFLRHMSDFVCDNLSKEEG